MAEVLEDAITVVVVAVVEDVAAEVVARAVDVMETAGLWQFLLRMLLPLLDSEYMPTVSPKGFCCWLGFRNVKSGRETWLFGIRSLVATVSYRRTDKGNKNNGKWFFATACALTNMTDTK